MYSFCSTSLSAYFSYCSTSLTGLPVQSRLSPSFCCKYKSFKTSSKITSKSASVFFEVLIAVQILQDFKYNHVSYQTKQTIFQVLITILKNFSKITSVTFLRLLNIAGPLPRLYRNSTKPWNIAFSEDIVYASKGPCVSLPTVLSRQTSLLIRVQQSFLLGENWFSIFDMKACKAGVHKDNIWC